MKCDGEMMESRRMIIEFSYDILNEWERRLNKALISSISKRVTSKIQC